MKERSGEEGQTGIDLALKLFEIGVETSDVFVDRVVRLHGEVHLLLGKLETLLVSLENGVTRRLAQRPLRPSALPHLSRDLFEGLFGLDVQLADLRKVPLDLCGQRGDAFGEATQQQQQQQQQRRKRRKRSTVEFIHSFVQSFVCVCLRVLSALCASLRSERGEKEEGVARTLEIVFEIVADQDVVGLAHRCVVCLSV